MLKDRISADLKEAMKAKDRVRIDALRSALSAFSYKKIEAGRELEEVDQVEVVRKQVKQRTDSIGEFEKAGRTELVAKETREREILSAYLPAQKNLDELRATVRAALAGLPFEQRTEGGAMKHLMPKLRGEADGATVRRLVLEELAAGS
ncbi:MAG: GatB/YqeY domain-containing protein [Vulcanimicrobiaceae bacterium]